MQNTNDYYNKPKSDSDRPKINLSLRKPMTFFLAVVSVILVMSLFFEIGKIDVVGNSLYTDKQILDASGIQLGDNLFFINRIGAGSRVVVKLPYVDAVQITIGLPNRITIVVHESNAVGYVRLGDELWSVSGMGKYLGTVSKDDAQYMAEIVGISTADASVGEKLIAEGENAEKAEYLLEILEQIQARGLAAKITGIDITDVSNPVLEYDLRFTVRFGERDNTEYKFGKLVAAVDELGANDAGTLDLSFDDKVQFNAN